MPTPEEMFEALGAELLARGAERSQMMGRPMFAVNGRMFACLSNDRLGVRLGAGTPELGDALALPGATLFSPGAPKNGGAHRVWRDWASLPSSAADAWPDVASLALRHRLG
ncbi:hypothetical protein B7R22_04110 [Subtercola boreus]|uniref:TfoX N-terminal domain-containing protein n=1 Tax=Subtercola boreus TaxID=120213 RepID=A0A3E0W4J0_9MICO|nr:hypothetical protein [Subtercola boreus]RFA16659.1 hypothetical protein B7R22_04110 [Subtercola boreus]